MVAFVAEGWERMVVSLAIHLRRQLVPALVLSDAAGRIQGFPGSFISTPAGWLGYVNYLRDDMRYEVKFEDNTTGDVSLDQMRRCAKDIVSTLPPFHTLIRL